MNGIVIQCPTLEHQEFYWPAKNFSIYIGNTNSFINIWFHLALKLKNNVTNALKCGLVHPVPPTSRVTPESGVTLLVVILICFNIGWIFLYCCKVGDICTGRFQRTSNTNNSWCYADVPASVNRTIMAVLISLTQTKGRRFHFGCFTLCQFCKQTLLFHLCAFVVWPFKPTACHI